VVAVVLLLHSTNVDDTGSGCSASPVSSNLNVVSILVVVVLVCSLPLVAGLFLVLPILVFHCHSLIPVLVILLVGTSAVATGTKLVHSITGTCRTVAAMY